MYLVGWIHFLFLHASVTSENTDDIRDTDQKNISPDLEFVANILPCMIIYRTSVSLSDECGKLCHYVFIVDNIVVHSSDVSLKKTDVSNSMEASLYPCRQFMHWISTHSTVTGILCKKMKNSQKTKKSWYPNKNKHNAQILPRNYQKLRIKVFLLLKKIVLFKSFKIFLHIFCS